MTMPLNIAIVVPCYNEEQRLKVDAFTDCLSKKTNVTLLFVNDGSKDSTLKIIQEVCKSNSERALFLSLEKNKGKGEAVRIGMCYLLEKNSYDIIGFWDADLAVPLAEVNDFVEIFRLNPNILAVIGSRVHLAGRKIERVHFRHYIGRIFATIMCLTFNFTIYDTQCGAKLFNSKILKPVVQDPFYSNWIFDVELLVRLSRLLLLENNNNWLYEIPLTEWKNVSGTKRSISAYGTAFFDYIRLVRKYLF